MDIFFNANPEFTKWMASSGALREPFVVVDVGVLGGENPRWHFLGDHLVVHGFDAIKEVIDDLSAKNAKAANKTYHWFAIGNEDGEREFFFKPSNPTNSSFYRVPDPELQSRAVPVRKLDTLLREGVIPKADLHYAKLPPKPSVDQILKTMSIYELHGLNDIAVDTAVKFSSELGQRLDAERAVDLLCRRSNFLPGFEERIAHLECERLQLVAERNQLIGERAALAEEVSQIRASTSWRMTAPLRSLVHRFRQGMR